MEESRRFKGMSKETEKSFQRIVIYTAQHYDAYFTLVGRYPNHQYNPANSSSDVHSADSSIQELYNQDVLSRIPDIFTLASIQIKTSKKN